MEKCSVMENAEKLSKRERNPFKVYIHDTFIATGAELNSLVVPATSGGEVGRGATSEDANRQLLTDSFPWKLPLFAPRALFVAIIEAPCIIVSLWV